MLVSQMIYTACGKNGSGDYSVWSKSLSVTKADCDQIVKLMIYRKPKGAPYEPTDEQIETLFPKKRAFFVLSDNKFCIAQTCYVGQAYSKSDFRGGNFIIHAYIFEPQGDFSPAMLFNEGLFRKKLEESVWSVPAPDSLPTLNLDTSLQTDFPRLLSFFNSHSREISLLAQAVINACNEKKVVTFNAVGEDIYLYFEALNYVLPTTLAQKCSYVSHYNTSDDMSLANIGIKPIMLRNVSDYFDYSQEISCKEYAFDFEKKLLQTNIQVSNYVMDVISDICNNRLAQLKKKTADVDAIMAKGFSIEQAIELYHVVKEDYKWFNSAQSYNGAMQTAIRAGLAQPEELAKRLYVNAIKTNIWEKGTATLPLIRMVFENTGDVTIRDEIIFEFTDNLGKYGIYSNASMEDFLKSFNTYSPFSQMELSAFLFRNEHWKQVVKKWNTGNMVYLLTDCLVCACKGRVSENALTAEKIIQALITDACKKSDLKKVSALLNRVYALGDAFEKQLLQKVFYPYIATSATTDLQLCFAFELIFFVKNTTEKQKMLMTLIEANTGYDNFVAFYCKYSEKDPYLFEKTEGNICFDDRYKAFIIKKDIYAFSNKPNLSISDLQAYFYRYCEKGIGTAVFFSQMKNYLAKKNEREKIDECFKCYDIVKGCSVRDSSIFVIVSYLEETISGTSLQFLRALSPWDYNKLRDMTSFIKSKKQQTKGALEIVDLFQIIEGNKSFMEYSSSIQKGLLFDGIDIFRLSTIIKDIINDLFILYFKDKKKMYLDWHDLCFGIFGVLFVKLPSFGSVFTEQLNKLNKAEYYNILADIMNYAFNEKDRCAESFRYFISDFFNNMNKAACKKHFAKIVELLPQRDKTRVMEYATRKMQSFKNGGGWIKPKK